MKNLSKITVVALIIAMVGVGIGVASKMGNDQVEMVDDMSINQSEKTKSQIKINEIVAKVNGKELTAEDLEEYAGIGQLSMNLYYSSPEFAKVVATTEAGAAVLDEYRKLKLDGLIEQELLKQEVAKSEISDAERADFFKDYLAQVKAQNNLTDEQLVAALNEKGVDSIDQFKEQLLANGGDVLILQQQVTADVTVEEAKVKEYYETNQAKFKTEEGQVISLDKVKGNIKNFLVQEKQEKIWDEYVAQLLEDADVQKLIEG